MEAEIYMIDDVIDDKVCVVPIIIGELLTVQIAKTVFESVGIVTEIFVDKKCLLVTTTDKVYRINYDSKCAQFNRTTGKFESTSWWGKLFNTSPHWRVRA